MKLKHPSDKEVPKPGRDSISSLTFSPTSNNVLVATNWDGSVRAYDTKGGTTDPQFLGACEWQCLDGSN